MGATEADRADAWRLQVELGWEEFAQPTPQQLLDFIRQCSDVIGLDLATKMLAASEDARRCWEYNHEGEIRYLRAQVVSLRAAESQQ